MMKTANEFTIWDDRTNEPALGYEPGEFPTLKSAKIELARRLKVFRDNHGKLATFPYRIKRPVA